MVKYTYNGVTLDESELTFRDKILVEQELNGKNHLYRCLMANEDENGNLWKDRIISELKGAYTCRDHITFSEFEDFCAEIEDWYNDNFDELNIDDEFVARTIYRIVDFESDIELYELIDEIPWLEEDLDYLGVGY